MLIPDLEYISPKNELPYMAPAILAPGIGIGDVKNAPKAPPRPETKLWSKFCPNSAFNIAMFLVPLRRLLRAPLNPPEVGLGVGPPVGPPEEPPVGLLVVVLGGGAGTGGGFAPN